MKYFLLILFVSSVAHAMGTIYQKHPFYFKGEIYDMDWDTEDINIDFFQECRNETTKWRLYRSKELKEHPYNHVSEYINATPCDQTIARAVANKLWSVYPGSDRHSEDFANFVTAFVNSYFYKYDTAPEYQFEDSSYKNIFDTFMYSGDCEDLALLLTALLSNSCIDTAFLIWDDGGSVTHATSSCSIDGIGGTYVPINGRDYFVIEAVGGGGTKYQPNKVGEKSSVMKGSITHYQTISKRNCS